MKTTATYVKSLKAASHLMVFFILLGSYPKSFGTSHEANSQGISSSPYKTLGNFQLAFPMAQMVELEHIQSGAKLILVKNSDPARTFTVSFRTPPYDDTGIFHIFEHAVIKGSRLYPSKSNINRVRDASVASEANAYTGPVSTFYPFVTKDPKDFENLLSVYMDAVFFPKAVSDPRLIKREGWRYEVNPNTKKMSLNGIVFNEMKGLFAGPYKNLLFHLSRSVLPQTPYANESGGLPEKIVTLQFDQIVETHKKYYHPQNSMIYLYGNIDYEKTLATIDEQFLRHFHRTPGFTPPEIALQTDFNYSSDVVEATYPGPPTPNNDFVVKTYVLGPLPTDAETSAAHVLTQALISWPSSPLKLRILREGLAQSVFQTSLRSEDNAFSFVFHGTDASQRERIGEVLDEELDKVINQGLDQEFLTSIVNHYEFTYKNKNSNGSHRGLTIGESVREHWLFPDQPLERDMDVAREFRELRELLKDESFIKDFFRKHFRENTHSRWLVMRPDPHFSEKFNAVIENQIEEALRAKPLAEYEKEDRVYQEWVSAKEPPEIKDKTPLLKLSDIKPDEEPAPFNKFKMGSTQVIEYPQETNGISYIKLFFDLKGVKEEDLKNLKLLTTLMRQTDTTNYPFQDLSRQISLHTGGFEFHISSYRSVRNPENFKPTLFVRTDFLDENRDKSLSLLRELLTESQFSPFDHVDALVRQLKLTMARNVSPDTMMGFAISGATKNLFPAYGAFNDETDGVIFRKYVLETEIDPQLLSSRLKTMVRNIFNQNRLYMVTLTGEQKELKELGTEVERLRNALPSEGFPDQTWAFSDQQTYDGYAIPGEVQYNVEMVSLRDQGLEYHGSMHVYSQYLDARFMIPQLREQGGAYGAEASMGRYSFLLLSYRDTHLKRTFDTFSRAVDFMKNENLDQETLTPFIIGSLKPFYSDLSVSQKTGLITQLHLTDNSWEDHMRIKREILSTTPEDFHRITEVLDSALENSTKSVAGNPKKLAEEAPFLQNILSLQ